MSDSEPRPEEVVNSRSRRRFLGQLTVLGSRPGLASGAPQSVPSGRLPIHDLSLPPDVLDDLEKFAEPVLRETRWLDELPLDNIDPAFVFVPRG